MEMTFDDSRLKGALRELDPKLIKKALRGGMSKTATELRRKAIANLRSEVKSSSGLEKGIRKGIYKGNGGFYVTIGTRGTVRRYKGKRNGRRRYGRSRKGWTSMSMTTNSRGQTKPVLPWLELGTKQRFTKSRTKEWVRKRAGHRTGRVEPRTFMEKTERQNRTSMVTGITDNFDKCLKKIISRYGK